MALKRYNGTAWVVITAADVGAEPAFSKNTAFNKNFGTSANTVCEGNDSRLSVIIDLGAFESNEELMLYILMNQLPTGLYKVRLVNTDLMLTLWEGSISYEVFLFAPNGTATSVRVTKEGEVDYYVETNLKEMAEVAYVDWAIGKAVNNLVNTNDSRLTDARTPTPLALNGAIGGIMFKTNTTGLNTTNAPYTILKVAQATYDGLDTNIKNALMLALTY